MKVNIVSYKEAIEAAGATVKAYNEFGSYNGDWWALVEYQGRRGWVGGYSGCCSECDHLQAEFSGIDADLLNASTGLYEPNPKYVAKLPDFGRGYLEQIQDDQAAINKVLKELDENRDGKEILKFIAEHAKADGVFVVVPTMEIDGVK
jgi:hypothetical protein